MKPYCRAMRQSCNCHGISSNFRRSLKHSDSIGYLIKDMISSSLPPRTSVFLHPLFCLLLLFVVVFSSFSLYFKTCALILLTNRILPCSR